MVKAVLPLMVARTFRPTRIALQKRLHQRRASSHLSV